MVGCAESRGSVPAVRKATLARKRGTDDGLDRRHTRRMRDLILPVGSHRAADLGAGSEGSSGTRRQARLGDEERGPSVVRSGRCV